MKEKQLKWLKYDLHMHSHHSSKKDGNRVKNMSAKEYVDTLISRDVDVFSVTDHNIYSKEYYAELREYITDKDIKLIDGVELDVYVDTNFFQMGVYFAPNEKPDQIEKAIKKIYNNGNKPTISCIISELLKLSIKFILIPEGDKARGVTQLVKHFDTFTYVEITKYAMYKIFSGYDVKENFDKDSQNRWASNFFKSTQKFEQLLPLKNDDEINVIMSNIKKKIKSNEIQLDEDETIIYDYIIKYGQYFTYFSFSDWHNAEKYEPPKNNFIFGSLETYFESFEIGVLDPTSRIKISFENEIPILGSIINSVSFTINDEQQTVFFSPGLNVIVGKRGSGKSLLVSVIERLKDGKHSGLEKYKKNYKVSNIIGKNYGKVDILLGSLSKMAVLEQNEIRNIYENPDYVTNSITSKFPEINELNMTALYLIRDLLMKLKPTNPNHKSLTSNIMQIKKNDNYFLAHFPLINSSNFTKNIKNGVEFMEAAINDLKNIGYNPSELTLKISELKIIANIYAKKLNLFNQLITVNNQRITSRNETAGEIEKINRNNRVEIGQSLEVLKVNLSNLLRFKKLEYLLKNFRIDSLPVEKKREGKYLFITSYRFPEDLNEVVLQKATAEIKKIKVENDVDRLKKYLWGDVDLLSNKTLGEEFKKFLNEDIFIPKKDFYQIEKLDTAVDDISNSIDVENLESNKSIINLNNTSLGTKSVAYLDMMFDSDEPIMLLDQPEDNIDNDYISKFLVPIIKSKKTDKQLIFVTHNPSVAVYGDAFNYIFSSNEDNKIAYQNYFIESAQDREKILSILDGGKPSFSNRNQKYGNILGEEEHGNIDN